MKTIKCPHCGAKNPDYWTHCHICKEILRVDQTESQATRASTENLANQAPESPQLDALQKPAPPAISIVGLITGMIISIVLVLIFLNYVGVYPSNTEMSYDESMPGTQSEGASQPNPPSEYELIDGITSLVKVAYSNYIEENNADVAVSEINPINESGYDYAAIVKVSAYIGTTTIKLVETTEYKHITGGDAYDWNKSWHKYGGE